MHRMVLGQMQHALTQRHLQVQRKIRLEAMLPIDLEPKEVDIKLQRLGLVENPQDGGDFS